MKHKTTEILNMLHQEHIAAHMKTPGAYSSAYENA